MNMELIYENKDVEKEVEIISNLYPFANFHIDIPFYLLNKLVSDRRSIIVINVLSCHCFMDFERLENDDTYSFEPFTQSFVIDGHGEPLTHSFVLRSLINQGLHSECDHQFLESITQYDGMVYRLEFGS